MDTWSLGLYIWSADNLSSLTRDNLRMAILIILKLNFQINMKKNKNKKNLIDIFLYL
jgi:hypothetical protein